MGLFDFMKAKGVEQKSFVPEQWRTIFGDSPTPFAGLRSSTEQLNEYKNWVYACVQARAEAVGEIELKLFNKDGEEITDHPLLDLLNKLNPRTTKSDHFGGTQSYLDLLGDAFWFLARDNKGEGTIKEIYLLRPDRIKIMNSDDPADPFSVKKYVYQIGANKMDFKVKEILHIPNFNPRAEHPFPYRGMSVIEAAANSVETDNEARQWNYSFFKNAARPDGYILPKNSVTPEQRDRLREMFEARHKGSENAHKIALLEEGMDFKESTRSQKDMDFIEQRRFTRDEILALFRVPKTAIGIVEDVNRANAEATNYVFALRTIRPLMQRIVDHLNEFLVPEFGDGLYLEFVSPVPEDRVALTAEYAAGIDKWLTRNEIRNMEGLPPTKDGDKIMGTLAQMPIDEVVPEEAPKKAAEKPTLKKEEKKTEEKFTLVLDITKRSITPEKKTAYIAMWKSLIDQNTKAFDKKLKSYMTDQEKEVLANLEEQYKSTPHPELKAALDDVLFDMDDAIDSSISLVTPYLKQWLKEAGIQATEDLIGSDVPFDENSPLAQKFVAARSKYFAKNINDTTQTALYETLKEGTEAGEGLVDLSKRVAGIYDEARTYRTDRIARTEVSAAANEGSTDAYRQAGVEKVEWMTVNPQDEDCADVDGEVVSLGEDFSNGIEKPPVHPNCECTTIPVFE